MRSRAIAAAAPLVALAVLVATRGVAQSEPSCRRHACSNDQVGASGDEANYGDERLVWPPHAPWATRTCSTSPSSPCTTNSNRRCYEVALWPEGTTITRRCETTWWTHSGWVYRPPAAEFWPYRVGPQEFPRFGLTYRYVVRRCEGSACATWEPRLPGGAQDYVELRGGRYACLAAENNVRCEKACYTGAPKVFPEIRDCAILY